VAAAISSSVPWKGTWNTTTTEGERSEARKRRCERRRDVEDVGSFDDAVRGEEFPKAEEARDRTSPSSPMAPRRTPPSDSLVSDTHPRPSRDPRGGAALAQVPGRRPARRLPGDLDAEVRRFLTGFSEETDRAPVLSTFDSLTATEILTPAPNREGAGVCTATRF
jgi:hypothetical protein